MSLNLGTQQLLSDGTKWFAYSGQLQGDVSVPASITLLTIDNTGLRDSYVCIEPFFATPITVNTATSLGIEISIDDIVVFTGDQFLVPDSQASFNLSKGGASGQKVTLFVPRQSKLTVISLNSSGNNNQQRGCNLIGYYL